MREKPRPVMSSHFVQDLDGGTQDAGRLGGKGSSLCRLVGHGYRVPPGFVVPVNAFLHACDALGLSEIADSITTVLASGSDAAHLGEQMVARLKAGRIPAGVLTPILAAIDRLDLWEGETGGVIVRSSATVEDSAAHSFAGIFESIPISEPDALEPAIREVWASVFSPRALTYFGQIGLKEVPRMAVIVQRFLSAERSGVMFTRFGGRMLVEHVEGGCEKLVKGQVTPEQLWIPEPGHVPAETGLLKREHAYDLSMLAQNLEKTFGTPQDVEWVVHEGRVHVVQSRPITTPLIRAGADEGQVNTADLKPVLTGIAASGGWGTGPVHMVFNIEDALRLESGRILVTPMTNPDMVVAMCRAGAIVTDVGGMICHAAIVSRELGIPCVVGTAAATTTLESGEVVTVAGAAGAVFRGTPAIVLRGQSLPACGWSEIWSLWRKTTADRPDLVPMLSSIDALTAMPDRASAAVLVPNVDLRCGPTGLWVDLEGLTAAQSDAILDEYFANASRVASKKGVERLYVLPLGPGFATRIAAAVRRLHGPPLILHADACDAPRAVLDPGRALPPGPAAVPLAAAALVRAAQTQRAVSGMEAAEAAALDTINFFGHEPRSIDGAMPDSGRRGAWWALLPEYARFHREYSTAAQGGTHVWLEVRPELVISALLKSLVQPGFEMVPRVMGFQGLPPMHIKWIKCRYYFRSDTFSQVWRSIVQCTWSADCMADLMRRVRASYDQLAEVLALFPTTDAELAAATPERMVALITSWWPRWVEFFALCWFIQAQGDDIAYPFLAETVDDNLRRASNAANGFSWPGATDLIAPTTPVMSGEYMASVGRLRQTLLSAGLTTKESALAALDRGEHREVAERLAQHLDRWHWMRDRDLLFEPWDTAQRVIDTALKTDTHAPADYQANLRRNRLALSVHYDLAHVSGRADGLNLAARFLHDLNVERENHHILWLKYSYPLRKLVLEIERRLVANGSLDPGDVFFLQAPELIEATRRLPAALPSPLVKTVKNRRRGYLSEARLAKVDEKDLAREDDYY